MFLPPMTLPMSALCELRDRMTAAMQARTVVLMEAEPSRYRLLDLEANASLPGKALAGVRLMAGSGITVTDGTLFSDGSVGLNFDFPERRPGNASLFGPTDQFGPYKAAFTETVDWLVSQGRYRWGWVPVLGAGGAALVALLLAGLVAGLLLVLEAPYAWLTTPFAGLTGIAGVWGFVVGLRTLIRRERARVRGVVVTIRP